jgi:uncharacterized protein
LIVIDSSAIVAALNAGERHHVRVTRWLALESQPLVTTPLVIAEVDVIVRERGGQVALDAFYGDVMAGAYLVEWWPEATAASVQIARGYADLGLGLTDASLVALAVRSGTATIATLDERHFRVVRPIEGGAAFRLLPADL